uniref:Acetylcholine-gated chlorid channel n=1 Tax=Cryptocotyle lingua TaxID=66766 RepID=A0A7U0TI71_9TREM|nr:acetylcholine-gated chlorid channel [Cryptocotyle lingua]
MFPPGGFPVFILCLLLILNDGCASKVEPTAEKALIRMLLDRYKQYGVIGRPVNDSRIRMVVQYGLQMIQILGLDENKQVLRSNCWTIYRWNDALLRWNPSQYDNITVLRIMPHQIWTPDIKLHNFADERLEEYREGGLLVYHTGDILWLQQALFKSTCQVEITYFPFDSQVCMLDFGSLTYDKTLLELEWWTPDNSKIPMPYVDFSDYVPANEWYTDGEDERHLNHENRTKQIRSIKRYRVQYTTSENQKKALYFPVLRFRVRLYRNPSFHMFILIIPCLLLSLLTLVVFWLPPDSSAKMMLGINIFVAFFVLLLLLAKSMSSAVKDFPLIGVFFCLNMVLVTLSQFLATMVVNLFYRGTDGRPPPLWARRLIIDGIGRLLHLRQNIPLPARTPSSISLEAATTVTKEKIGNAEPLTTTQSNYPYVEDEDNEAKNVGTSEQSNDIGTKTNKMTVPPKSEEFSSVGELKADLDFLDARQFKGSQKQLVLMEWHTLALVVDRVFFMLYLTIMLGCICLVVWNYDLMQMIQLFNTRNALNPVA